MSSSIERAIAAVAAVLALSSFASAQAPDDRSSLDSLLNAPISSASKYEQRAALAPASVTLVTRDEIRDHGYRNLQELLEGVTGLYTTYDRNYAYLGVRGFSRPGDYNNRILLLVDGHTLNDNVWGQAPIGSDLPVPMEAIERVEIVRGPGSVVYGSNAMFGVINIVTRSRAQLPAALATVTAGSAGARQLSAATSTGLAPGITLTVSGLREERDGLDLRFSEFDAPATPGGIAHGLDWERRDGVFASLEFAPFVLRGGYRSRSKGIPTAPFGVAFDHPDARSREATLWQELNYQRRLNARLELRARAWRDDYRYTGAFPYDAEPGYHDLGTSTSGGAEIVTVWDPISRYRLTSGFETKNVMTARYRETYTDGSFIEDDAPFTLWSLFAQNELQLLGAVTLVAGLSHDHERADRHATTPRLGAVITPGNRTVLKLLYGQAFRSPSRAEADLETSFYVENPALRAEQVETYEAIGQYRFASGVLGAISVFQSSVTRLIDQTVTMPAQYVNRASVRATGVETSLEFRPGTGIRGRVSHAFSRAKEAESGQWLSNSPQHIVMASATAEVPFVRPTLDVRHESSRRTVVGGSTPAFTRADLNLVALPTGTLTRATLAFRVTNLLDARYYSPGGFEHRQQMIEQDGRNLSLSLGWRF